MRPEEFVVLMRETVHNESLTLKYGTVPAGYVSGLPTIQFDGESVASTRAFPHLSSYTPAANDRVALLGRGTSWLIVGKVSN